MCIRSAFYLIADSNVLVMRTTARTTNFSVVLLGAGLSVVLLYALTSELFSKNSPTVLYGEACDKIKASPQVHSIKSIMFQYLTVMS